MSFTSNFSSVFSIWMPFNFVPCLSALGRAFSNMLNKSGRNGHSCHFPEIREKISNISPLSMMWVVCLSYMVFTMLRHVLSTPNLPRVFIMKESCILSNDFFCIYWDGHLIFIFYSINSINVTYHNYYILKHPCIPRMSPFWSQYKILSIVIEFVLRFFFF